jgi:hypothetical protein
MLEAASLLALILFSSISYTNYPALDESHANFLQAVENQDNPEHKPQQFVRS